MAERRILLTIFVSSSFGSDSIDDAGSLYGRVARNIMFVISVPNLVELRSMIGKSAPFCHPGYAIANIWKQLDQVKASSLSSAIVNTTFPEIWQRVW